MYTILDPDLKVCGFLSLDGSQGCKFYDDLRTTMIADDQGKVWNDTLQISVPYGHRETELMKNGYHLAVQGDDGRFYCYRIYNYTDSAVGPVHVKSVQAINLCIWDLNHITLSDKTFTNIKSTDAFNFVLRGSGWQIGTENFVGTADSLEFTADQKAQAGLDNCINEYGVEVRAYVEIYAGQVVNKKIDILQELGVSQGRRLEYSRDLQGITRTGDDSEFYTLLHVYGPEDSDGNKITISSINGGKDYVVDDDANDVYNHGGPYLEGYVASDNIKQKQALLDWGKEQLQKYNHPKFTYTVDVAYLGYLPGLGDHIEVVDFSMQPELTIAARVLQRDISEANPQNTKVTIGEFVEVVAVTPADIWELQAKASQAQQAAEKALQYKVEAFTPDGLDFATNTEQKRVIIRVYEGTENVTYSLDKAAFVWQKINADGTHDTDWEAAHVGIGNIITVGIEVAGSTIRCSIGDATSAPVLFAEESDAAYFATLPMDNPSDDVNTHVAQYAQVDAKNGYIYWSQEYFGSKKSSNGGWQSFSITRTTLDGEFVDQMWVIGGGHGSNFGIEHSGSDVYIWSAMINTSKSTLNGTTYWGVARFKYTPGAIVKYGASGVSFYSFGSTTYYRVNFDEKNNYVHLSKGEATFYVCKTTDIKNGVFKPLYTMDASEAGFNGSDQTFQSSCLDFPYVYFCAGDMDGHDQRVMYCADIRSRSLVYKIVYTFDKGTVNQIGAYNEPEAISVYYDTDGTKWLVQGFSWGNEDAEDSQRTNQLFRIRETQNNSAGTDSGSIVATSPDVVFTNATQVATDAQGTATQAAATAAGAAETAGQAQQTATQAADAAGQAQATAQTASQTATQAAATAADAAQAAQTAITTANGKNKAYYGATTPTSPQSGDIWFVTDANGEVTAIRHWDDTQWVDDVDNVAVQEAIDEANQAAANAQQVGEQAQQTAEQAAQTGEQAQQTAEAAQNAANQAQQDANVAKTQAQSAVDTANQATQSANNASQTASDAATQASSALTQAQSAMAEAQKKADASSVYTKTEIDDALEGYATTTTVNTLTGRVDSAETAIQQNTDAIQLKADKSTVDTLTGRISTAEATLTAQADQIAARITEADADAKYATQTALTATANSLTSNISAVQTNLDNLKIGGRNYLRGTGTPKSITATNVNNQTFTPYYFVGNSSAPIMDKTITVSFDWEVTGVDSPSGVFRVQGSNPWPTITDNVTLSSTNKKGHVSQTRTITGDPFSGVNFRLDNVTAGAVLTISNMMIELGNKESDWTPAPEDMATQSQISQLSDDINLRVQKNDVINQINLSTESILIGGNKVHITGQTTIDNAVIKDAMIDSMTADKLTAGTIDANVITVKNINASNIVTGTLDASKATVTNIDASNITTGTLNAERIAAGSIDASKLNVMSLSALSANLGSVTAGNISGVNINIGNGNFTVDTSGNLVAKSANITGTITGSTINGSEFNSSGENGEIHIYDEFIESFEQISDIETSSAIISSGNFSQTYRVSSSIYKESSLAPGSLMIYDINSSETDITGGEITTAQINITSGFTASNGGGSIILKNGDIVGINAIYLNDAANVDSEGLIFPWSTSTNVLDVTQADCLRAYNGRLLLNGDVVHTEKSMMIASGNVAITPSSSNTPTYKTISFGKTFPIVPTVVVTPNSTVPGTTVTGWAVTDVTTTGCKIWVTRTNTTNTWLSWVAVADNTNWTATAVG